MREIALHILDIVQNSVVAGATRIEVDICEDIPKALIFIPYWSSGKWIKPVTNAGKAALERFKE